MIGKAIPRHLLPTRPGLAVIAIWIDRDPAPGKETPQYLDIFRIEQSDDVLHNDIHAVFVEIPMIAERKKV